MRATLGRERRCARVTLQRKTLRNRVILARVGSAVNDTTRELRGALGIALLGSIANSAYRSNVELGGLGLPAEVTEAASESVGAAAAVAHSVPDGGAIVTQAASAFTDAFNLANGMAVAIAVAAAVGVLAWSRRRDVDPDPGEELIDGPVEQFELELAGVGASEV